MLAERHRAEVALQAVQGRLFILLDLEYRLVQPGVRKPCLSLALVLLDRQQEGFVGLVDLAFRQVVLADDSMQLRSHPWRQVCVVRLLRGLPEHLVLGDLLRAVRHFELELLVNLLEELKLEGVAAQRAAEAGQSLLVVLGQVWQAVLAADLC